MAEPAELFLGGDQAQSLGIRPMPNTTPSHALEGAFEPAALPFDGSLAYQAGGGLGESKGHGREPQDWRGWCKRITGLPG
jgi:hypothetical protein